jgi:hypothetical protein
MANLFSNTFKALYFKHLVGTTTQHFINIVIVVERIKQAMTVGKIINPSKKKCFTGMEKEI